MITLTLPAEPDVSEFATVTTKVQCGQTKENAESAVSGHQRNLAKGEQRASARGGQKGKVGVSQTQSWWHSRAFTPEESLGALVPLDWEGSNPPSCPPPSSSPSSSSPVRCLSPLLRRHVWKWPAVPCVQLSTGKVREEGMLLVVNRPYLMPCGANTLVYPCRDIDVELANASHILWFQRHSLEGLVTATVVAAWPTVVFHVLTEASIFGIFRIVVLVTSVERVFK